MDEVWKSLLVTFIIKTKTKRLHSFIRGACAESQGLHQLNYGPGSDTDLLHDCQANISSPVLSSFNLLFAV